MKKNAEMDLQNRERGSFWVISESPQAIEGRSEFTCGVVADNQNFAKER